MKFLDDFDLEGFLVKNWGLYKWYILMVVAYVIYNAFVGK